MVKPLPYQYPFYNNPRKVYLTRLEFSKILHLYRNYPDERYSTFIDISRETLYKRYDLILSLNAGGEATSTTYYIEYA